MEAKIQPRSGLFANCNFYLYCPVAMELSSRAWEVSSIFLMQCHQMEAETVTETISPLCNVPFIFEPQPNLLCYTRWCYEARLTGGFPLLRRGR